MHALVIQLRGFPQETVKPSQATSWFRINKKEEREKGRTKKKKTMEHHGNGDDWL